jgi:hypothetical protein
MLAGATPLADGAQDVLVRFKAAAGEALNLYVPAAKLVAKGKKLSVKDGDGSAIAAISDQPPGQDQPPAPPATAGGSLTIKRAKKRTAFIYKVNGVETAQLTGPVDVTVGFGTQSATRTVTFKPGKKGAKFH